jgi:hypothetical protein
MIRCLEFLIPVYICGSIRTELNESSWLATLNYPAGLLYRAPRISSTAHHVPGSLGVVTNSGLLIMYFRMFFLADLGLKFQITWLSFHQIQMPQRKNRFKLHQMQILESKSQGILKKL